MGFPHLRKRKVANGSDQNHTLSYIADSHYIYIRKKGTKE